jgi:hypothetical protein
VPKDLPKDLLLENLFGRASTTARFDVQIDISGAGADVVDLSRGGKRA